MTKSTARRYEKCVGCDEGIAVGQPIFTKGGEKFCSRQCAIDTTHNDKLTRTDRILKYISEEQGGVREAISANH